MDISTGLGILAGAGVLATLILLGGDLRMFADMHAALTAYRTDVSSHQFPGPEHTFGMDEAAWTEFLLDLPGQPEAVAERL